MGEARTVLITGSSRGLGAALVRRFADAGWKVAASMIDPEREAPEFDGLAGVTKIALDVSDTASITRGVAQAIEALGHIDLLINNAGYGSFAVVEAASEQLIQRLYQTNALGPVFVTRAVLPHMREQGEGTIVFVSSSIAAFSAPFHGLYGACKWATDGFAEALTYETADLGVRIKIVSPGAIASTYFSNTEDKLDGAPDAYQPAIRRMRESMGDSLAGAPSPELVAEEVFTAATDPGGRLRYYVTEQARKMVGHRREIGDETWVQRALDGFKTSRSVVNT